MQHNPAALDLHECEACQAIFQRTEGSDLLKFATADSLHALTVYAPSAMAAAMSLPLRPNRFHSDYTNPNVERWWEK